MPFYSLDGVVPVAHPSAFVHPSAEVIGDVWIGAGCYVGPLASLRGDFGRIILREGSNLQDCCVMHAFPGRDCVIDVDGHVGHGTVLHGCTVGVNALVGMNSVVMDEAVVGEASIVGANSFVRSGFIIPPRKLAMGSPAKVMRDLSDDEMHWKSEGTRVYQSLARRCIKSLVPTQPLREGDEGRARFTREMLMAGLDVQDIAGKPLAEVKRERLAQGTGEGSSGG